MKKNIIIIFNIILIIISLLQISHSKYILHHCNNGQRTVLLENNSNLTLSCIDCPEGKYTFFDEKKKNFQCQKCVEGSSGNKNDILINNFLSEDLLSLYSFSSFCSIENDLCPKWTQNLFSIRVNYTESLSYKSSFSIKQYYMNEGELIVKYINYNGAIDRVFNIYINGKLAFTDDTNNNILKTKYFDIKKGENIFNFEYLVNQEVITKINKDSFLEIFEIKMKNAEISAINCDKYDILEKISSNILNNCEFDVSNCNANEDVCDFRFYSEIKTDYCLKQSESFFQYIEFQKIKNAKCKEITTPPNRNDICDYCSYGQYTFFNDINKTNLTCYYCENKNYNSKEINDESSCKEICEIENDEKQLVKIQYIKHFEIPNYFKMDNIIINQPVGYAIIYYKKFNEKQNTIFFIEIDNNYTQKIIEPNNIENTSNIYSISIPFTYGEHSLKIKGSNLNLNKILIKGSEKGGNYQCIEKINFSNEIICEKEDEHFSELQKKCTNCPLGTTINKNKKCELYNQIINDKYTLDNNEININLFSDNYELINEKIKYFLNLYPTNPLIYKKDMNSNNNNNDIIGKELKYVKIVKGINERGIILSYISEKDKLYFYIKCNLNITEDMKTNIYLKKVTKDDFNINNYFFVIESNTSCPFCITSEVNITEKNDSQCIKGLKKASVTIKNDSLCVIKNFDTEEKLKLKNDINILLNKNSSDDEDQILIQNFEIDEEIPVKYEEENDEVIYSYEKDVKCVDEEKNHALFIAVLVLFIFVTLVCLGLGAVIVIKILDNKKKEEKEVKNNKERMSELSIVTSDY